MRFIFRILLLLLVSSGTAKADEFEDEVIKMLSLSNTLEPTITVMEDMLKSLSPAMIDQLSLQYEDQGSNVTRDDVRGLVQQWRSRFIERVREELIPVFVEATRSSMSLEEVRALNELLDTPVYRKYANKMPQLTADIARAAEKMGERLGLEIMQELVDENPRFR